MRLTESNEILMKIIIGLLFSKTALWLFSTVWSSRGGSRSPWKIYGKKKKIGAGYPDCSFRSSFHSSLCYIPRWRSTRGTVSTGSLHLDSANESQWQKKEEQEGKQVKVFSSLAFLPWDSVSRGCSSIKGLAGRFAPQPRHSMRSHNSAAPCCFRPRGAKGVLLLID